MNQYLTEIICILDRSGSMKRVREEAISGINGFLEDQRAVPGNAILTMVRFDTEYEVIHNGTPIHQVPMLDETTYRPRGMTALYDAIGRTIDDVGHRLSKTPENDRPAHVIVAILTDGYENASSDYDAHRVREMIHHQQLKYDWDFIYLGANQNAFAESGKIGIRAQNTRQWESTSQGTTDVMREMSLTVRALRNTAMPSSPTKPGRKPRHPRGSKGRLNRQANRD